MDRSEAQVLAGAVDLPSIAIILVNYNGWRDTVECVESILRLKGVLWRIIIVDNASVDGSVSEIERYLGSSEANHTASVWSMLPRDRRSQPSFVTSSDPENLRVGEVTNIVIVQSRDNLGFAGGNNLGIEISARIWSPDFFWLLNNDTVVHEDAAAALVEKIRLSDSVGVCGSTLMHYDAPSVVQSVGVRFNIALTTSKSIGSQQTISALPSEASVESEITYVQGASMMIPRGVIEETGGLYPGYFLYFEELDFSRRIKPNYKMAWSPDSIVYHKEGSSIGTSAQGRPSDASIFYMHRAMVLFYFRNYKYILFVPVLRAIFNSVRYIIKGDLAAARAVRRGVQSALSRSAHRSNVRVEGRNS